MAVSRFPRAAFRSSSLLLALALTCTSSPVSAFTTSANKNLSSLSAPLSMATKPADAATVASENLYDPAKRDAHYKDNIAQYLLDLHDNKATFDFCGGMLFQLVLTDALRDHLKRTQNQPVIFDAAKPRMRMIPEYQQTSAADNIRIFHGREIRQVPTAAGGMGMVLQLSLADASEANASVDPEGWTRQELDRYDGWGHDSGREWRKGPQLEEEGFATFRQQFGSSAFSLHHRFYLHLDGANRMWLSAEDGCEGTPAAAAKKSLSNMFGLL